MPLYFDLMDSEYPFAIESIGEKWSQGDTIRPKGYPYYHWLQTTKGQGEIEVKGEKISLPKNCGILLSPFTPHKYYPKNNESWETSFLTINGTLSNQIQELLKGEDYLFVTEATYYENWIHHVITSYEKKEMTPLKLSVETYDFLLHLTEHYVKVPYMDNKLHQTYVKPVIAFVEKNYPQDFSIEELSKEAFITPQYLNRLFQKFYRQTTTEYVNQYRIKKAKEFLITKKETEIQVIAQLVGFKSASHFIATFKKLTGYTPMNFREMYVKS